MAAAGCVVTLKRKVRSAETKLFEWQACECSVAARGPRLLLLLRSDEEDEENDHGDENAAVGRETVVDLASQLLSIAPKKNRARCELEYRDENDVIHKEQLMAPSATHCQRWITQVRRAQEQAQRQQQRRVSGSSQSAAVAPVAPLPSSTSPSPARDSKSNSASPKAVVLSVDTSVPANAGDIETARIPNSRPRETEDGVGRVNVPSVSASSSLASSVVSTALGERLSLAEDCDVGSIDTEDSSILSPALETELAVPRSVPSATAASVRSSSTSSFSTSMPMPTPQPARRRDNTVCSSTTRCRTASSPSSSSDGSYSPRSMRSRRIRNLVEDEDDEAVDTSHRRHRRRSFHRSTERFSAADRTRTPASVSRNVSRRASEFSRGVSSASLLSTPSRLRARRLPDPYSDTDNGTTSQRFPDDGEASQAELHILQRVEGALRALELENAQAKARERELTQQIQTLEDAARVATAERRHVEQECRHARGEAEAWRRSAQSAEAAAAHLQEQLGIAREENQLLSGERRRLKRQNGELLAQVHRLDSLVYGRF